MAELLDQAPIGLTSRGAVGGEGDANVRQAGSASWPLGPHLSAPETVHWAITYACRASCPDCYARRHKHWFTTELSTADALRVVDRLAEWGVLQLAIGGGEPTLRADLSKITRRAREHGLIVHVTTGDVPALARHLMTLRESVSAIQVGIQSDRLLGCPAEEVAALAECVALSEKFGVSLGANLMLSKPELTHFDRLLELLAQARIPRLTLLRYKPPAEVERWQQRNPSPEMLRGFEDRLAEAARCYPQIAFRVDCALSFLQRQAPEARAQFAGIRGCVAASRILALSPDGSIFPCSQLAHPRWSAGHVLVDDPGAVWARAPVMERYRFFRVSPRFRSTTCGQCRANAQCGGCRIFADDAWAADPGCPEAPSDDGAANPVNGAPYPCWS